MQKVFISYSHEDSDFVEKVTNDLHLATELNITIDKRCLAAGDSLTKIFDEIGMSAFLVPVLSSNSASSNWCQKELRTAIVKEIEDRSFKVIPIVKEGENWASLSQIMPGDLRQALRDKVMCRFDEKVYSEVFQDLVRALAPSATGQDIYACMADPEGENPFRRVRAEHFREPQTFVELFAEPEIGYDTLVSPKPTFIEGGRGSGKTMVLKSLQASIAPLRMKQKSFAETKLPYFGIYFRATQDTFATYSTEPDTTMSTDAIKGIFYDELILRLAQSILEEIFNCIRNGTLEVDRTKERVICQAFVDALRLDGKTNLDLDVCRKTLLNQICLVLDYVRAKARRDQAVYSVRSLTKDNLIELCKNLKGSLPELRGSYICFLVDEYENLNETQKIVLNTLVKWHNAETFSFKLATKKTGFSSSQTLEGQELEEGPDYSVIDLDFYVGDKFGGDEEHIERKRYERYLKKICANIMKKEGFCTEKIEDILESRIEFRKKNRATPDGITTEAIRLEVDKILSRRGKKWSRLTREQKHRALEHFSLGAEYRLLGRNNRSYGGFHDFVTLSSGVVRVFLELCGMAYYFARQDKKEVKKGHKIEIKHQTEAAYNLSEYYLWRINKNIDNFGPTIRDFTVDIGDVFRQKLLRHLSEPEAAILSIYNSQNLRGLMVRIKEEKQEKQYTLKKILDVALLHSVLQEYGKRGGRRGKLATIGQPNDYILNRIFAPVLQISPRPRWPTVFYPEDIQGLLDATKRAETKRELIEKVTKEVQGMTLPDFLA
jgi:hypothetical protein